MSRRTPSIEANTVRHVISRFVGQEYFLEKAEHRRAYLCLLGMHITSSDWRCFSFAVMSNHIHLGLLAGTEPLATWMRPMHTAFAQWINEQRTRIGAVFVRGPNVIEVRAEGVARLISYIHCNPVRAGVVTAPHESDWTSHRAYLGQAHKPSWLDVALGLELAGFQDQHAFRAWADDTRVSREELDAMRVVPVRGPGRPKKAPTVQGQDGTTSLLLPALSRAELP